ncbi:hypothetical protein ACFVAV_06125 [Nocardia sp. NPDC057663]|uniref:hypothetical protein n=1 Tax=Nocardia sp. NPDC057663 TaxID=3346201 RepID=UPI00366EAA09
MSATASEKPPTVLAFEPILNGVDFLDRAINELLEAHNHRELKYAVLHLQAAVEILVKVRLQREGYEHIFEDPALADKDRWTRGDFRSVGLSAALARLEDLAEIKLERKERKAFDRLGRERNKLQHYGSTSNHEVVLNTAGKAMEVLSRFIVSYLVPDAPEDELAPLENAQRLIGQALREIQSVTRARMDRVAPQLDRWSGIVIQCPECIQMAWTFEPHSEDSVCHLCSAKWWDVEGRFAAEQYAENILYESRHLAAQGKSGWSIGLCPECDEEALTDVATRAAPETSPSACFACGFTTDERLDSCSDCGRAIIDIEFSLCPGCFSYRVAKD